MSSRVARTLLCVVLAGVAVACRAAASPPATTGDYGKGREDVQAFIAELARNDGFDRGELKQLFAQAQRQPRVIAAMSRPVLAPPKWYEYAPQFLNPRRIDGGVAFWSTHAGVLDRAQSEFGVPAEIIVAIIGVETFYGRNTGSFRVLDALSTLAFDYPRRAEFFLRELRQYLLLCREQGVSPLQAHGSFAGAMGLPQFMPGSFRSYALDYDRDGRIDLATSAEDAIGSVAHYLARHDWHAGEQVVAPASIDADTLDRVTAKLDGGLSERRTLEAWAADGVSANTLVEATDDPAGLLMLEEADGPRYRLVFNNWYVVTRYNKSRLYATAVWELAQAIRAARAADVDPLADPTP